MSIETVGQFNGWEWRERFVESLLRLSPDMNPDAADEISDSQFASSADSPAEQAAEKYLIHGGTASQS